jgi:hypothetical protein
VSQGLSCWKVELIISQFAKSLMTNGLTPDGVNAWITRLYDTGPTNSRVSTFLCRPSNADCVIGMVFYRRSARWTHLSSPQSPCFRHLLCTPRSNLRMAISRRCQLWSLSQRRRHRMVKPVRGRYRGRREQHHFWNVLQLCRSNFECC